jgi:hypothetical protein
VFLLAKKVITQQFVTNVIIEAEKDEKAFELVEIEIENIF